MTAAERVRAVRRVAHRWAPAARDVLETQIPFNNLPPMTCALNVHASPVFSSERTARGAGACLAREPL
jgi:hypothetical protein